VSNRKGLLRSAGLKVARSWLTVVSASMPLWVGAGYLAAHTYVLTPEGASGGADASAVECAAEWLLILNLPYAIWLATLYLMHGWVLPRRGGAPRGSLDALSRATRYPLSYLLCWCIPVCALPVAVALRLGWDLLGSRISFFRAFPMPARWIWGGLIAAPLGTGLYLLHRGLRDCWRGWRRRPEPHTGAQ